MAVYYRAFSHELSQEWWRNNTSGIVFFKLLAMLQITQHSCAAGVHFVFNYVCFYLGVLKITLLKIKTTLGMIVCHQKTIPAHSSS